MIPLAVSIAAAIISAFSASISTRQLYRAQRTRLGELVDEITKADAEFDQYLVENDFKLDEGIILNHGLRVEVLARQALEIVRSARSRPSSREIVVLANTFAKMNDLDTTEVLFKQAFEAARREGSSYLAAVHREYGIYLFDICEHENASSQLGEAIALISPKGGDRSLEKRFECLGMRAVQHARHDYRLDDAEVFLREAQAVVDQVHGVEIREGMRGAVPDYRGQIEDAKRRAGKRPGRRQIQ